MGGYDNNLKRMTHYHTLFKNAPIIILVYWSSYENDAYNMLKYLREDEEKLKRFSFDTSRPL